MLLFVTGGSASGKSEYAEERCLELAGVPLLAEEQKMRPEEMNPGTIQAGLPGAFEKRQGEVSLIYLATMINEGKSSRIRIERHRSLRAGKGFQTVECPVGVAHAAVPEESTVLLECVSNLLANEMFAPENRDAAQAVGSRIFREILELRDRTAHLVLVSNQIFSEGWIYDPMTEDYRRALAELNRRLAAEADEAWEVVCGIPLRLQKTI